MYAEWLDESELPFKTMDRSVAYPYVPEIVRPHIMPAICICISMLIQDVNPVSIYRVTKTAGLPEKALRKHHMITKKFVELGYTNTQDGTDGMGRPYWLMSR